MQDADFCNEYTMAPTPDTEKTVDVLMVSTPLAVKNLPMFAKAIKVYEQKYAYRLKSTIALGTANCKKRPDGSLDYSETDDSKKKILDEMNSILYNRMCDYINFEPYVNHGELPKLYTASKCTILTSLIEGKNRCVFESISCDTPAIVFKAHNQWARGEYPIFFDNSGEYAPEYTPESLADTIHKVINNPEVYEPRKNHLLHSGRKNFIDICTSYIPYYRENIPDYDKSKFHENLWVDLACQRCYNMGYNEFLYGKRPAIQHVRGLKDIDNMLKFYFNKFGIK